MSLYNSAIRTHIIDPIYFNNRQRCEFRLNEDALYLSNLRLVNVGCIVNGISATANNYNIYSGVFQLIKNVFLYDGGNLLSELRNVNTYMAFKNYNKSNDNNKSLNNFLYYDNQGYKVLNNTTATIQFSNTKKRINNPVNNSDSALKSWINLQDLLGMLNATPYVSSKLFPNLRVVLEFENDVNKLPANFTQMLEPALVADELVDDSIKEKLMKEIKTFSWMEINTDRVTIPGIAAATNQTENKKLKGFDKKFLRRLLVVKSPNNNTLNNLTSYANNNEEIQFVVNGKNLIPYGGLTQPNQKLQYLTESWGECNHLPGGNFNNLVFSNTAPTPNAVTQDVYGAALNDNNVAASEALKYLSYVGVNINNEISDLQITFKRTGTATASDQQIINLNFFGEVNKTLLVEGNDYLVSF